MANTTDSEKVTLLLDEIEKGLADVEAGRTRDARNALIDLTSASTGLSATANSR